MISGVIHPLIITITSYFNTFTSISVELQGFEPWTPALQRQCSSQLSYSPSSLVRKVGLGGLEPPTSRLSGVRSNHLSYKPQYYSGIAPGSQRRPQGFSAALLSFIVAA